MSFHCFSSSVWPSLLMTKDIVFYFCSPIVVVEIIVYKCWKYCIWIFIVELLPSNFLSVENIINLGYKSVWELLNSVGHDGYCCKIYKNCKWETRSVPVFSWKLSSFDSWSMSQHFELLYFNTILVLDNRWSGWGCFELYTKYI